jgi:hypothetical protein
LLAYRKTLHVLANARAQEQNHRGQAHQFQNPALGGTREVPGHWAGQIFSVRVSLEPEFQWDAPELAFKVDDFIAMRSTGG